MAITKRKIKKRKKKLKPLKKYTPEHFFNREMSWLEFNARVLNEARDIRTPLLERIRFLTIYTSNLDEFFMKRVGGLKAHLDSSYTSYSLDGLFPDQQLELIRERVIKDNQEQEKVFLELKKELFENDIELINWKDLTPSEKGFCNGHFTKNIYPILTPLSVDSGRPFPFISNLSYSLGIYIENPMTHEKKFSRVKVPESVHRWISLPGKGNKKRFINTEDIIANNLSDLYHGMNVLDIIPFRITRNADWDHDDEDTEDLLELIEESINIRRLQEPIRIECLKAYSDTEILSYLIDSLGLSDEDVYFYETSLDYTSLSSLCDINAPELKHKEWRSLTIPNTGHGSIFESIYKKDRLIHHPYENFKTSVEKFILDAAQDPNVLSIKMTLYRTEDESPFIQALINAADNGIQVVCLIELKARFDEKRNIQWAKKMEEAGVHVVYGIVGLKTHSKIAMVVRKETNGNLLRYVHIGTGNYNSKTARLYTDMGIFTVDERLTMEVNEVFNYLTGTSLVLDYKHLLVSPVNAKSKFLFFIEEQIKRVRAGKRGAIFAKMNSLEDPVIIESLYRASQAGVIIKLVVRGFCCLKPRVSGLSENIDVISIVGRFLEHSRIYFFATGEKEWEGKFFIGSADWMHRNLHSRVEVLAPIYGPVLQQKIVYFIKTLLEDKYKSWTLKPEGHYVQSKGDVETYSHHKMMKYYLEELRKH